MPTPIPYETARYAVRRAAGAGVRVLLNAAPARLLDAGLLRRCDPLVVNEHEAAVVLGKEASSYKRLARELALRATSVVITLGERGAIVADGDRIELVPAPKVTAVDTTGAGDVFVGAAAVELARGTGLHEAVRFATAMAALAVQHGGAQSPHFDRPHAEELLGRCDGVPASPTG